MKKILAVLFASVLICTGITKAAAMNFEEGLNASDKKPMVVLLYADWADSYQNCINAFDGMKNIYVKDFNFVKLNIANQDARFFNSRYHIYPNLPYVLMYRDGGKISRYVQRDCVIDDSCLSSRLKAFIP